jgi:miniconductance mechanosensitive channel
VRRTKTTWDDILVEQKLFTRIAHLAPATVIYSAAPVFPSYWTPFIAKLALVYVVVIAIRTCIALLSAVDGIYGRLEISRANPIKGFVQTAKLLIYILGGIFLLSVLLDKDPWGLIGGIGAVTAVLLLVFKDSILGLVASIQIIVNDLVHIGDWIEMPSRNIDGDIVDITLTTIKIRNFDATMSTIPTYALITDSFKNWRAMTESGGRRIKRSISIDMNSIRFCDEEMLKRFERFDSLKAYIQEKRGEISQYNQERNVDTAEIVNGRRMTNIGTFRAYLKEYLSRHERIDGHKTFLVRHLSPSEKGLPVEIYIFTDDTRWVNYEEIQADIFDHILAVIPEFGLRAFQSPAGADLLEAFPRTHS